MGWLERIAWTGVGVGVGSTFAGGAALGVPSGAALLAAWQLWSAAETQPYVLTAAVSAVGAVVLGGLGACGAAVAAGVLGLAAVLAAGALVGGVVRRTR